MAIRKILHYPDKRLRVPGEPVTEFDQALETLVDDMAETMREEQGVGLAAPQVGVNLKATVIEWPDDEENPDETMQLYELINPEVVKVRGSGVEQEGCLSLPGLTADVKRPTYLLLKAQNRHGEEFRMKVFDWLARVFLHEIDHLQGIMMTDKLEQLYRLEYSDEKEDEIVAVPIQNVFARVQGFEVPDAAKKRNVARSAGLSKAKKMRSSSSKRMVGGGKKAKKRAGIARKPKKEGVKVSDIKVAE